MFRVRSSHPWALYPGPSLGPGCPSTSITHRSRHRDPHQLDFARNKSPQVACSMCTRLAPGTKGCLTSVTDTVVDLFDEMNARVARVDTHPITVDGDTTRGGDACVLRRATRGQGWPRLERPGMARAGPTQHTRTSAEPLAPFHHLQHAAARRELPGPGEYTAVHRHHRAIHE